MSFTFCGFSQFNWHSFAQLPAWRLFLWSSLTRKQRYLVQIYFYSRPALTWSLELHFIALFSLEKPLRWKKIRTHARTHTTHTYTPIHTQWVNRLEILQLIVLDNVVTCVRSLNFLIITELFTSYANPKYLHCKKMKFSIKNFFQ